MSVLKLVSDISSSYFLLVVFLNIDIMKIFKECSIHAKDTSIRHSRVCYKIYQDYLKDIK